MKAEEDRQAGSQRRQKGFSCHCTCRDERYILSSFSFLSHFVTYLSSLPPPPSPFPPIFFCRLSQDNSLSLSFPYNPSFPKFNSFIFSPLDSSFHLSSVPRKMCYLLSASLSFPFSLNRFSPNPSIPLPACFTCLYRLASRPVLLNA